MPGCRLIQDFLVPALDRGDFGEHLYWENAQDGTFRIRWTHKAKSSWTSEESSVFTAWDIAKNRPVPESHQDFVNSKQRLRAALRNIKTVLELPGIEGYRRYRIQDLDPTRDTQRTSAKPKAKTTSSTQRPQEPEPHSRERKKKPQATLCNNGAHQSPRRATAKKCIDNLKKFFEEDEVDSYEPRSKQKRESNESVQEGTFSNCARVRDPSSSSRAEPKPRKTKTRKIKAAKKTPQVQRVPPMRIIKTENTLKVEQCDHQQLTSDQQQPSTSHAADAALPTNNNEKRRPKNRKQKELQNLEWSIFQPTPDPERPDKDKKIPKRKSRVSQECWASSLGYYECLPRRSGRSKNVAIQKDQEKTGSRVEVKKEKEIVDDLCANFQSFEVADTPSSLVAIQKDQEEIGPRVEVKKEKEIVDDLCANFQSFEVADTLSSLEIEDTLPILTYDVLFDQPSTSTFGLDQSFTNTFGFDQPSTSTFRFDQPSKSTIKQQFRKKRKNRKSTQKTKLTPEECSLLTREVKQEMIDDSYIELEDAIVEVNTEAMDINVEDISQPEVQQEPELVDPFAHQQLVDYDWSPETTPVWNDVMFPALGDDNSLDAPPPSIFSFPNEDELPQDIFFWFPNEERLMPKW